MKWVKAVGMVVLLLTGCERKKPDVVLAEQETARVDFSLLGNETLSSYGFFKGKLKNLEPEEGVVPYFLNSSLFSDYAYKKRFVKIPKGTAATYNGSEVLDFPEGTVLIKNFYYPADFRKPNENIRIMETRLLILQNENWKTLPYVWNDQQTEAYLEIAGRRKVISWTHFDGGNRQINYSIPNVNQCKGCHLKGSKVIPIGLSARQLNGVAPGQTQNQLVHWAGLGMLKGLPPLKEVPVLAAYENKAEPIEQRARAWLEINCAHCHRPDGPAKTSGLHLSASVTNPVVFGVGKAPVAAGKGSGGRLFGIVPGHPKESILQYRIESTDPGVMMPEMGRVLVHEEGIEIVRQWISGMK